VWLASLLLGLITASAPGGRQMEQVPEQAPTVATPTASGAPGRDLRYSLSTSIGPCRLARSDIEELLAPFPAEATLRLAHQARRRVSLNGDGFVVKDKGSKAITSGSKRWLIEERALDEFSSALAAKDIRIIDDFHAEVSWEGHQAVLDIDRDGRKVLAAVAYEGNEPSASWPVKVLRHAEAKMTFWLIVRILIRLSIVALLAAGAISILRHSPAYSSWNGYLDLWKKFGREMNKQDGTPSNFPPETLGAMVGVPLLGTTSLLIFLTTRRRLRRVRCRVVMAAPKPWRRLNDFWQDATSRRTWQALPSTAAKKLATRLDLDPDRTRVAILLLGVITVITIITAWIAGTAAVGVFFGWMTIVFAIVAWIWPRQN
jgi:hypothetical protein